MKFLKKLFARRQPTQDELVSQVSLAVVKLLDRYPVALGESMCIRLDGIENKTRGYMIPPIYIECGFIPPHTETLQ